MMSICFRIVLGIAVFASIFSKAQTNKEEKDYPIVGEICPDILFNNLKYLKDVNSLADLRGTWVLLDFWSKGCSGCVASFPKLNELQQEFKGRIQIVLIGNNDRMNKGIESMYEKFRSKLNLDLAVSFDSTLFVRFGIYTVPHVVIVSPSGIVHEVTYGDELNSKTLRDLVDGRPHLFNHKPNNFEEEAPAVQTNQLSEASQILSGSFFSSWKKGQPVSLQLRLDGLNQDGEFSIKGAYLEQLYNYAYVGYMEWLFVDSLYGKWHQGVILEGADQSPLEHDYESGQGLYNYYLKPKAKGLKLNELMLMLRDDLAKQFGYEVSVEDRQMPVWVLTATDQARKKLATRHDSYRMSGDHAGLQFQNASLKNVLEVIRYYNDREPPVVDNSEITTNIDISIDALMNDFDAIKSTLKKKGLILSKGYRNMKVIVLRESVLP